MTVKADSDAAETAVRVVVVGAGLAGVAAAVKLNQAGIADYVVLEKAERVGGTWRENTYPGARVDVGSHFYCYSFEPAGDWTEFFAQQPELQAYFERVMDRYGVIEHVRFGTPVECAEWDDDAGTWTVALDDGTTLTSRAVIWRPSASMMKIDVAPFSIPMMKTFRVERTTALATFGLATNTSLASRGRSITRERPIVRSIRREVVPSFPPTARIGAAETPPEG